jgi:hypothetical protein
MRPLTLTLALLLLVGCQPPRPQAPEPPSVHAQAYTQYKTWSEVLAGAGAQYPPITRLSDPAGSSYTGFWFYDLQQFDDTGRYSLAMKVTFQNRALTPSDRGDIGIIDLWNGNRWTKIGESMAWNWQNGVRLTWRPRSDEILWNDRSSDGTRYVTRVYNVKTGARRTLPRPFWVPSPDGATALTWDFERQYNGMHGIPDPYAGQLAPAETGLWKMDLDTGSAQLMISLRQMAEISGFTGRALVDRAAYNPSGTRFYFHSVGAAWTAAPNGTDIRFLYTPMSHSAWVNDTMLYNSHDHLCAFFADTGSGQPVARMPGGMTTDLDPSFIAGPNGPWLVGDTYPLDENGHYADFGNQYLFLFHMPTKTYIPLVKKRSTALGGDYRVDYHNRVSRNGRLVSFDSSHEGMGRQLYTVDIGYILDHPPGWGPGNAPPDVWGFP